jgi:transcriptional regulator with XRE-family HTH domain
MLNTATQAMSLDPSFLLSMDTSILDVALGCIIQIKTVSYFVVNRLRCFTHLLEPGWWQALLHFGAAWPLFLLGIVVSNDAILRKIDRLLKHVNISRTKLAKMIDTEQSYLQKMLTGQRTLRLDILDKIAKVLGLPTWQLLKAEEHQPFNLGHTQVPVVDPVSLRYLKEEPIAMENVKRLLTIPKLGGIMDDPSRTGLVAVEIKNSRLMTYILDPYDRRPQEGGNFLCYHKEKKNYTVRPLHHVSRQWMFIDGDGDPCLEFEILGRALCSIENLS